MCGSKAAEYVKVLWGYSNTPPAVVSRQRPTGRGFTVSHADASVSIPWCCALGAKR